MTPLPLRSDSAALVMHHLLRVRSPEEQMEALDLYLHDATLVRHFTARELAPVGQMRRGAMLTMPPPTLWQNIAPTLTVAEWLRSQFGNRPVHVHSAWRSTEYNRAVGGAENSLHARFNALDLHIGGVEPEAIAARLEQHTDSHQFGIGVYDWGIHLDSRGMLGMDAPARWDERTPKAA